MSMTGRFFFPVLAPKKIISKTSKVEVFFKVNGSGENCQNIVKLRFFLNRVIIVGVTTI